MSMSAAGEGLLCTYTERLGAQASQTPHRRPSGDSPAQRRVPKLYYQVASSHLPAIQLLRVLQLYDKVASVHLPAP